MECQNCHQPVEAGAAFCGNCGQQLAAPNQDTSVVPAYALATPIQHAGETEALLSLLAGAFGIVAALLMPLLALALGLAGIVLGSATRQSAKRAFSTAGLVLSVMALLAGVASWAYAARQQALQASAAKRASSAVVATAAGLSTPCYSANFIDRLNIANAANSCTMSAFNGGSLDTSTDAYKVFASKTDLTAASDFSGIAKQALENDIKNNLPDFTIVSERVAGFAGSPAYAVTATDTRGISIIETAVYHPVKTGDNVFIVLHAVNSGTADLRVLEAQWQWK